MDEKRTKTIKIVILVVILLLLIYLSIQLLPLFKNLTTVEGRIEFKETIENLGVKGAFIIVGLMLAQVLLAILPGEPIELVAGMCYGPVWGTIIILIGAFLSSVLIFFSVRKFGRGFVYSFADKERIEKLEKSKWFSNEKRLEIIFLILFLIPGTPKDLFVYIAGILPVKPLRFILISTLGRFPSIITSTAIGDNILDGDWKAIIMIIAITIILTILIIWLIRKKDKKLADDIINSNNLND